MSVNSVMSVRFKAFYLIGQRRELYRQRIPESSCVRKETVDIDILITSRNGDRKIMESIRKETSKPPLRTGKQNQLIQVRWTWYTYRKGLGWLYFSDEPRVQERQQVKNQQSCILVFVAYPTIPISNLEHQHRQQFHAWPYGRFVETQSNLRRKKLHRTNQGSNFVGVSFINRDNIRIPIQFGRESQPQCLLFFQTNHFLPHSTLSYR